MTRSPLELPPIPPTDCNQARFAKILLDQEVAEYNTLKCGDTEQNGLYIVDEALLRGRERRLKMMSDYLIEYIDGCEDCTEGEELDGCEDCSVDKEPDECPMRQSFDFIVGTLVTIDEDS